MKTSEMVLVAFLYCSYPFVAIRPVKKTKDFAVLLVGLFLKD